MIKIQHKQSKHLSLLLILPPYHDLDHVHIFTADILTWKKQVNAGVETVMTVKFMF